MARLLLILHLPDEWSVDLAKILGDRLVADELPNEVSVTLEVDHGTPHDRALLESWAVRS